MKRLKYFIWNCHRPVRESFHSWLYLFNLGQEDIRFFKEFFWDELSMFSPSYPYMDSLDFWEQYRDDFILE
jgi:hypothetical protein